MRPRSPPASRRWASQQGRRFRGAGPRHPRKAGSPATSAAVLASGKVRSAIVPQSISSTGRSIVKIAVPKLGGRGAAALPSRLRAESTDRHRHARHDPAREQRPCDQRCGRPDRQRPEDRFPSIRADFPDRDHRSRMRWDQPMGGGKPRRQREREAQNGRPRFPRQHEGDRPEQHDPDAEETPRFRRETPQA